MQIKIYSTPGCSWCRVAKNFLKERGFEYEEIDVSDPVKAEEMIQKTGQMGVPVIEIDDQFIIGFDKDRIMELLKISE